MFPNDTTPKPCGMIMNRFNWVGNEIPTQLQKKRNHEKWSRKKKN